MSGASTVPTVLGALIDLWDGLRLTAGSQPLQVEDGPVYDPKPAFLAVGWDRTDQPAIIAAASSVDLGLSNDAESYDVSNLLSLFVGNSDLRTIREQLFATFTQIRAALITDPTLGGVCEFAEVTDFDYIPDEGETGDLVEVRFTVHVEAYPHN